MLTLPANVHPEVAPSGIATGQIVWYTLHGYNTDLAELRTWQDQKIAPRLRQLSGIAEVASVGGFQPELNIDWNGAALAEAGLSFAKAWSQVQARCSIAIPENTNSDQMPGRLVRDRAATGTACHPS